MARNGGEDGEGDKRYIKQKTSSHPSDSWGI